ncbi:MAG TPA: hypothetical protein VH724_09895, partial [Candidatus Angelobacter sp.]|nr:hypothetical protein [Candidatus Angelobacter sp.]
NFVVDMHRHVFRRDHANGALLIWPSSRDENRWTGNASPFARLTSTASFNRSTAVAWSAEAAAVPAVHKPAMTRSAARRLGARLRPRLRISR